jgi:hypothetical protein
MVASATNTEIWLDQSSALVVYMSQPSNNIRLPTYSPAELAGKSH